MIDPPTSVLTILHTLIRKIRPKRQRNVTGPRSMPFRREGLDPMSGYPSIHRPAPFKCGSMHVMANYAAEPLRFSDFCT